MKRLVAVPTFVSSLRIAALPIFVVLYNQGNVAACLSLMAVCAATDYLDGYAARRLNCTSQFGAYYDAVTDFVLMFGVFAIFTFDSLYPLWLPILIALSFAQFLATSLYAKKLYDPIGRYMGSALYVGIALTFLIPAQATYGFVQYAFLVFFAASLASRIISLTRKRE